MNLDFYQDDDLEPLAEQIVAAYSGTSRTPEAWVDLWTRDYVACMKEAEAHLRPWLSETNRCQMKQDLMEYRDAFIAGLRRYTASAKG
jgi:hypothetical protein